MEWHTLRRITIPYVDLRTEGGGFFAHAPPPPPVNPFHALNSRVSLSHVSLPFEGFLDSPTTRTTYKKEDYLPLSLYMISPSLSINVLSRLFISSFFRLGRLTCQSKHYSRISSFVNPFFEIFYLLSCQHFELFRPRTIGIFNQCFNVFDGLGKSKSSIPIQSRITAA